LTPASRPAREEGKEESLPGRLDEELTMELVVWRLVTEKVASLQEIDEHWCINDVFKANAMLDLKIAISDAQAKKQAKRDA